MIHEKEVCKWMPIVVTGRLLKIAEHLPGNPARIFVHSGRRDPWHKSVRYAARGRALGIESVMLITLPNGAGT